MEKKNIVLGNVKIAEFMGWKKDPSYGWLRPNEKDHWEKEYRGDDYLEFHYSWDWLMGVVEKIADLGFCVTITEGGSSITSNALSPLPGADFYSKLGSMNESLYKTVLDFIDWYSTHSPDLKTND